MPQLGEIVDALSGLLKEFDPNTDVAIVAKDNRMHVVSPQDLDLSGCRILISISRDEIATRRTPFKLFEFDRTRRGKLKKNAGMDKRRA